MRFWTGRIILRLKKYYLKRTWLKWWIFSTMKHPPANVIQSFWGFFVKAFHNRQSLYLQLLVSDCLQTVNKVATACENPHTPYYRGFQSFSVMRQLLLRAVLDKKLQPSRKEWDLRTSWVKCAEWSHFDILIQLLLIVSWGLMGLVWGAAASAVGYPVTQGDGLRQSLL